jgi:CDP-glucose 4,6-dehydratase
VRDENEWMMKTADERNELLDFEVPLRGQRVFVTGHTGFTGGWLVLWLKQLGCDVAGLSLAPVTQPDLYTAARVADGMASIIGDIRDLALVKSAIEESKASIIFHLAAQPLVSRSFADPIETFQTNVIGTANVLEAARLVPQVKGVVCVTTDKVYQDQGWSWGYRETDPLGGKDPYSASKACAELVAMCYRQTMAARGNAVLVANARGGNIIGGGDWSMDRLVPDFVRAVVSGTPLSLRHSQAVRPWQHVMALVHGYLILASRLLSGDRNAATNWNFGPADSETKSVAALVERLGAAWVQPKVTQTGSDFPETQVLRLDSANARTKLGWSPPLAFEDTVRLTATWYRDFVAAPDQARQLTIGQIERYRADIRAHATN